MSGPGTDDKISPQNICVSVSLSVSLHPSIQISIYLSIHPSVYVLPEHLPSA